LTPVCQSDRFIVLTDIHVQRSKAEVQRYSLRLFRAIDPDDFAVNLQMTDVYISPADDVDGFCSQIQSSVTTVLDALARHFRLARSAVSSATVDGCLKLPLLPSRNDVVSSGAGRRPALRVIVWHRQRRDQRVKERLLQQ